MLFVALGGGIYDQALLTFLSCHFVTFFDAVSLNSMTGVAVVFLNVSNAPMI